MLEPSPVKFDEALLAQLQMPPGFKVNVFAKDLQHVRWMQVAANGDVYVSRPRQADVQGDGLLSSPKVLVDDLPDGSQHPYRTLAMGADGFLYVTVGSQCNNCVATNPETATVLRMRPDGSTLGVLKATQDAPGFLDDLVIPRAGTAYVTDSFQPVIYRVHTSASGPVALEPWPDLAKTPLRYRPNEINLNGIVASVDGRYLLSIQLVTGQLWRIDTATRAVQEVRIQGGDLTAGDGLVVNAQLDRRKNPPVRLPFDIITLDVAAR